MCFKIKPWQSVLFKAVPAATSTQNFIHMGQDTFSDRLGYFDYGPLKNAAMYGITYANTPPQLHPAIMKALPECFGKVNLIWSENDWMADIKVNFYSFVNVKLIFFNLLFRML
jgi:hypothetical protein